MSDPYLNCKHCGGQCACRETRDELERLRKALSMFTMAFEMNKEKLDRHWSIGYWEGVDPGLVLVNGGKVEEFLENTRFRAAVKYGEEEIREALAAVGNGAANDEELHQ